VAVFATPPGERRDSFSLVAINILLKLQGGELGFQSIDRLGPLPVVRGDLHFELGNFEALVRDLE